MSLRQVWYSFLAALALAVIVLGSAWFDNHWQDPDLQTVTVNFAVSWIPFLVTILVAFVPDLRKAHIAWRVGIVTIGFVWSLLLARQQVLTLSASRADQQAIVTKAVTLSNQHSDQQIENVRSDVQGVKQDLKITENDLVGQLAKTDSDINTSITKVGTAPVKYALLQFEFFDQDSPTPKTTQSINTDADGGYTVDFTATNTSDTAASALEIWVYICKECTFTGEPAGFDRPQGMKEFERHKFIPLLNPGVTLEKMTIRFKISGGPFTYTDTVFNYSCTSCGKIPPSQSIRGFLSNSLQQPNLKSN